jgi:cytochrome c553
MRPTTAPLVVNLALVVQLGGCATPSKPESATASESHAKAAPSARESSTMRDPDQRSLEAEAAAKPDLPAAGASLDRVMRAHFKDALLIRQAVIAGRTEEAADPATALTLIQSLDGLPPGWRPFVERMQEDARRVKDSLSDIQVAAATADLGVTCGACHQKHGGPAASQAPPPAPGSTLESRMKQHVWASERLWEGLAVPSSEAWNRGASALRIDAFPEELLRRGGVHTRRAAVEFTQLVSEAPAKRTIEERAGLYAELLVTCSTCHRSLFGSSAE